MSNVAKALSGPGKNLERIVARATFWLHQCLRHHGECHLSRFSEVLWPPLPKRVVDVGMVQMEHRRIRLVGGSGRRGAYCALSYRWHAPETALTTTAETAVTFQERGIPFYQLQRQIQEAFLLASRLGIRYVWVDALVSWHVPATEPRYDCLTVLRYSASCKAEKETGTRKRQRWPRSTRTQSSR